MRTLRTIFMVFAAFAATAYFIPARAQQHLSDHDDHSHHTAHLEHLSGVPHDHIALADMHTYASHHLGMVSELPDTYGETDHWTHDWELRWVDYDVSGNIVRVYHAINKHDDGVRFASSWDGHQARYHDWEPIH